MDGEMTNLESLRSLQKRIREATGPDREIDLEICKVFGIFKSVMKRLDAQGSLTADNLGAAPFTLDPDGLGPCVALMRMLLPGWPGSVSWNNLETNGGTSFAYVHTPIGYDGPSPWPEGSLHHNNTCLALLYAIFSALIAQEEANEKAG